MRRTFRLTAVAALALAMPLVAAAQAPQAPQTGSPQTVDSRLYAFLDQEFAEELRQRPQLATQLGLKDGRDRLDDICEAAALRRLEWRRSSVERMKARFDRSKLSPAARTNYDIWALELERAELGYRFRQYTPAFYSFLYSAHSRLPDFLINTHGVQDAADMRAYAARLRAIPAVLDEAVAQSRASDAVGVRAPKFQVERVIAGSRALLKGAPFEEGPRLASVGGCPGQDRQAPLRRKGRRPPRRRRFWTRSGRRFSTIRPAYERVIAWGQAASADGAERPGRSDFAARRRGLVFGRAQAQHDHRPHRRRGSTRSA